MSKKILSIVFCIILACTAGTACSQLSESSQGAESSQSSESPQGADSLQSSVTDSSIDLDIPSNAILGEGQPIQDRFEADRADSSASINLVNPDIPESLKRADSIENLSTYISDTSVFPFSAIAHMVVGAKCGCTWACNGFMVGPRGLVTAAHCLVCPKHHATLDRAVFYFGTESNYIYKYEDPFYYWFGTDFSESSGYSIEKDFGYVQFDRRVGDTTGWFGVYVLPDDQITSRSLTLAGYHFGVLDCGSCYASGYTPNSIIFSCDAAGRNDGAPLFFYENGNVYATAINAAKNKSGYSALRITDKMFYDMEDIKLFN